MLSNSSEAGHLLVFIVFLEVSFDSTEQIFFDLSWYKLSSLWQEFLNEVFKIDLVETLGTDNLDAVLFELVFPAALYKLCSKVFFELLFLT